MVAFKGFFQSSSQKHSQRAPKTSFLCGRMAETVKILSIFTTHSSYFYTRHAWIRVFVFNCPGRSVPLLTGCCVFLKQKRVFTWGEANATQAHVWILDAQKEANSISVVTACGVEQIAGRLCVAAAGGLKIVSPLRASFSLQHVGTMARCQDTSPSSVLTRRHEEQRLIIYKQTPVRHVWLGTSPAFNVTIYEVIRFIAHSI